MEEIRIGRLALLCVLLVVGMLLGCTSRATVARTDDGAAAGGYAGALDLSYEGALDVQTQLALGTLRLEGTANAVTQDQAAVLLPLWQALAGSALQGDAERSAVLRQIEASMAGEQVAAIAAMRLTAQDLGTWTQAQVGDAAPGGQGFGGGQDRPSGNQAQGGVGRQMSDEARATRQAQFQNISPEQRATVQAQFGQGGAAGGGRPAGQVGAASGPLTALIALLRERAGTGAPPADARSEPTRDLVETATLPAAETPAPTATPTAAAATATTAPVATLTPTSVPTAVPTGVPTGTPTTAPTAEAETRATPTQAPAQSSYVSPALQVRPDTDPGPPLVIEVSANRAYPDPLVEESRRYLVSGIVRNEGSETYDLSALHVTFFDAEGFRGSYRRFPGPYNMGGEWIYHGLTEADVACLLLAPGEECPFIVHITAQDMASVLIHPDASETERQSVPLEASGLRLARDGTRYVTISGKVANTYSFPVKNVALSGVLLDAAGEIVSLGAAYVVEEDVMPGQVTDFSIRVYDSAYSVETPFVNYRLYAQAERGG